MDRDFVENNNQLTSQDKQALVSISPCYLDLKIDILKAIDTLAKRQVLSKPVERRLLNKYSSQQFLIHGGRFLAFLSDIVGIVSFSQLYESLISIGCNVLATELLRCREGIPSHPPPNGYDSTASTALVRLHGQLKSKLDNNEFPDKFQALWYLSKQIWRRQRQRRSQSVRQLLVDSFAVVVWLIIHTYRDENIDLKMAILNGMMANIPRDLNPSFARMVYLGRAAVSYATAGDWERARYYVSESKTVFVGSGESFSRMLLVHDIQLVSRLRETRFGSQDDTQSIIHMGDIALKLLPGFPHSERSMWGRIFRLNMVQAMLSIKTKLVVDFNHDTDVTAMSGASSLLEIVGSTDNFGGIESRREMIYSHCQAVLLEKRGDIQLALAFANRAVALSGDGRLFASDCENVRRLQERLYRSMLPIETENPE